MTETEKLAQQRLRTALDLIERAQNTLRLACETLSPLSHGVRQWEVAGKAYDHVHKAWRRIAYNAGNDRLDMDSDWKREHGHAP